MKRHLTAIISLIIATMALSADPLSEAGDVHLIARVGYNIGGTAPLPMPPEIRKLNSYSPRFSPSVGFDMVKNWSSRWGTLLGVRVENKGMYEDANVKNYYMELVKAGNAISGNFTGDETTYVRQWMVTVPLAVTLNVRKVMFKFGPYASMVFNHDFSGWAHSGYLRVDDPTGDKVMLGEEEGERGDYDFSDSLRDVQFGMQLGADWQIGRHWGAYADLSWGVTGIFNGRFNTIRQTLYPIYATIGVVYRIK